MIYHYEGNGMLRTSLDFLKVTEELVNCLSSKIFQRQSHQIVDDDSGGREKPGNDTLDVFAQLLQIM